MPPCIVLFLISWSVLLSFFISYFFPLMSLHPLMSLYGLIYPVSSDSSLGCPSSETCLLHHFGHLQHLYTVAVAKCLLIFFFCLMSLNWIFFNRLTYYPQLRIVHGCLKKEESYSLLPSIKKSLNLKPSLSCHLFSAVSCTRCWPDYCFIQV